MKGDFSRSTFRRIKHYRKVKLQQGRVQLDSDWNEQVDIQAYYDQMSLGDIIGSSGAPADSAGFSITSSGPGKYQVGAGRYYVNGLMVENEKDVEMQMPQAETGKYIAFLRVCEQGADALDDPNIRESALGGADTSVRAQIVWEVIVQPFEGDLDEGWEKLVTSISVRSTGTLAARVQPEGAITDSCMLPPGAGYRRLENQLYRIEIHDAGTAGNGASFKWSRDNGSVSAAITKISGSQLTVSNTGKDRHSLAFKEDQWIEITDERRRTAGLPGTLAKITRVEEKSGTIVFGATIGDDVTEANFQNKPRIIRWDSVGKMPVPAFNSAEEKGFVPIEDGVEVKFGDGNYRPSDYWLIPARTARGDVEWPRVDSKPEMLPAEGIVYHYCRLGILQVQSEQSIKVTDLRNFFPSITTLTTMQYVGGDGQRGSAGALLPAPLMVGVSRGGTPLAGVVVRFEVKEGEGALYESKNAPSKERELRVTTDSSGIAQCLWQLDHVTDNPRVEAVMLDIADRPVHLPVVFNAAMDRNGPPLGLRVHSGLIREKITAETYKIVGPYYHDVDDLPESTAPPSIMLGETNIELGDENIAETVTQMEDLTLLSLLNKQYGIPTQDSPATLMQVDALGLDEFLDKDAEISPVPLLFKPVAIDKEKFYVLIANYNKNPSQIAWTPWVKLGGKKVTQIAAGTDAAGHIELFAASSDGLWHISQTAENANWGEWVKLSGQSLGQIVATKNSNGTLHIFGIQAGKGNNDKEGANILGHMWQDTNGNWSAWTDFTPQVKAKKIVAGHNADGRLELFGVDMSDIPGHMWQKKDPADMDDWTGWYPMRGIRAKHLAVARNADGRLELFATGHKFGTIDTGMVAVQYSGDLFKLSSLVRNKGKAFVMQPFSVKEEKEESSPFVALGLSRELKSAVYENAFKNVEAAQPKIPEIRPGIQIVDLVFHAWQVSPNGDWSSWSQLGNQQAIQVAAASNADGRLEAFVIGYDEKLYNIWQTAPNNGWSGWASLGGKVKDIVVASNADGRIEVFAATPRANLILSTGLLLDARTIAGKLNRESLDTLGAASKIKAATVSTALINADVIKKTDVQLRIRSEDVAKFRELAILKAADRDVASGNALYHIWQTAPNNGWSGWASLGGKVKDIVVASNADGRLSAFAISDNDDSAVNNTSQMRIENEINLRWWAVPAIDVPTRKTPRAPDNTKIGGTAAPPPGPLSPREPEGKTTEKPAKPSIETESGRLIRPGRPRLPTIREAPSPIESPEKKQPSVDRPVLRPETEVARDVVIDKPTGEESTERTRAEAKKSIEKTEEIPTVPVVEVKQPRLKADTSAAGTRAVATSTRPTSQPAINSRLERPPVAVPKQRRAANMTRCTKIAEELEALQTQQKSKTLTARAKKGIASKIRALNAEKTRLKCPD